MEKKRRGRESRKRIFFLSKICFDLCEEILSTIYCELREKVFDRCTYIAIWEGERRSGGKRDVERLSE